MAHVDMDPNISMTANELKTKLYHQFRQKGLVDSLKSQLRTKLVNELRGSYTSQRSLPSPSKTEKLQEEGTLMQRAANSLVADHLRRCQYEYSLAVFLPESETGTDKMFTIRELLGLLGVHAESQLFQRVTENIRGYHPKGLLWQLLCELTSTCGRSHEKGVQVDNIPAHIGSIEKKLTAVDELFEHGLHGRFESTNQALQGQLLSLQRKMEARNKEEITREICRFKESEGKRIELEEREKCRKEIAKARREMEITYQAKVESLMERERHTMERIQRHQEMVERETYSQRQSLLEELQILKQKESGLKREAELNERAMNNEESRRKAIEENLKMREASLARIEETYDNRYKDQIRQYEMEQQNKLAKKIQDIEKRESRLRENQNHLENEKELLSGVREEVKERKSRITELEVLYQQSRYESVAVNKRNEVLGERLKDMMDYHSIKEDNAVMRQELHNEKRRLAEVLNEQKIERTRHEEALTLMAEKTSQPSPQIVILQANLQRTKCQLEQERNLLQHKEAQYRASLQNERDHSNELRRKLEDQSNQMREMTNEIGDMRQTLRQTQQALSNEIYRKSTKLQRSPTRSPNGPFEFPEHDSIGPVDHYIDTSLHQMHIEQQLLLADDESYPGVSGADSDRSDLSPNATLAFLDHTKARFQQLEREAETLEQNYHNFQYRITDVHDLPSSPPQRYDKDGLSSGNKQVSSSDAVIKKQPIQPSPFDNGTSEASGQQDISGTIPLSMRGVHSSPQEGFSRPSHKRAKDQELNGLLTTAAETKHPQSPVDSLVGSSQSSKASLHEPNPGQSFLAQDDNLVSVPPPHESNLVVGPSESISDGESLKDNVACRVEEEEFQQEDSDKREEAMRLQHEEEEKEDLEWEEKRKKREEERKLREQEARQREQAMLMELQQQESGQKSDTQKEAVNPDEMKTASDLEEESKPPEQPDKDQKEEEGLKIDPIMQKYMQMIQTKKDQTPADKKPSPVSTHSEAGLNSSHEIEATGELSSTGHVSDNSDDPFDDW